MHANTIETTANQQGWTLHTGFAGGQWLETSSPAGEDLIIDVPSGRPIPETVHEHAEQFDPDEHVRALVRSPMKGQPGTIAELLEDAKAIQTMLDRLDAALSDPPDDDPHWEQWTAEALDEMLDDVAHKASSLAQTVLWHHHAANHGIETPENTRRQCLCKHFNIVLNGNLHVSHLRNRTAQFVVTATAPRRQAVDWRNFLCQIF